MLPTLRLLIFTEYTTGIPIASIWTEACGRRLIAVRVRGLFIINRYVLIQVLYKSSSTQADLRKAAIFVLVEVYMVVGDALYPFTQALSPPQRKLLTIYVDRKLKQRNDVLL